MMGEQNNVFDDFVLTTGNIVATVRLLVEGAITLYEDEASPLFRLGLSHNRPVAATAFEVIGTALYEIRTQVMALQERHILYCGSVLLSKSYRFASRAV